MAAQKGLDVLLKVSDDGGSTYNTIAGFRANRFSINSQTIDVTNADSAGRWREMLAAHGTRNISASGDGVFTDGATDETIRAAMFGDGRVPCELVVPDFGTFTGPFQITTVDYSGTHDGEATYSYSLESAGEITWTAAT